MIILQLFILLFSVILHEVAHGWMASKHGDDTARLMGRLTFNPVPHIDPIGTILLPALAVFTGSPVFGWAKPVPVNPYRLNNPQKDMIWVSLAGPGSNLLLAIAASAAFWAVMRFSFLPPATAVPFAALLKLVVIINVLLPVFNLIPIPPLDGSRVLMGILPPNMAYQYAKLEPYGFIIIFMLLYSRFFSIFLWPVVNITVNFLLGGM